MVKIIRTVSGMHRFANTIRAQGRTIGFVPTMGALHEGHLSLVRRARKENDKVVVSIFVNPLQFGPKEDFKAYPRDLKKDREQLRALGVDVIFSPNPEEMYPKEFCTFVLQEGLTKNLCGASRPGHFQGVTTVVSKLFLLVKPHRAYFGQKDAQQAAVIKQMVRDLNMDLKVVVLPIVRDRDGLALSSRNLYLSEIQRKEALCLVMALKKAEECFRKGERSSRKIIAAMRRILKKAPSARIDYIAVVDSETLRSLQRIEGKVLVALAVYIGKIRLIDNTLLRG